MNGVSHNIRPSTSQENVSWRSAREKIFSIQSEHGQGARSTLLASRRGKLWFGVEAKTWFLRSLVYIYSSAFSCWSIMLPRTPTRR